MLKYKHKILKYKHKLLKYIHKLLKCKHKLIKCKHKLLKYKHKLLKCKHKLIKCKYTQIHIVQDSTYSLSIENLYKLGYDRSCQSVWLHFVTSVVLPLIHS